MGTHTSKSTRYIYETAGNVALQPRQATQLKLVDGRRGAVAAPARMARAQRHEASVSTNPANSRSYLVFCVALVFLFSIFVGLTCVSDFLVSRRQARAAAGVVPMEVVVEPGDSLWSLAEAHGVEGMPTREVVRWIERENSLQGALIVSGETLLVPGT